LEELLEGSEPVVSSQRLAEICGVNPAQIRKDLAYFGQFGVSVGWATMLRNCSLTSKKILGLNKEWNLALVGAGNLGCALIAHENFVKQGYRFVAAFDSDPDKVGLKLATGLVIQPCGRPGDGYAARRPMPKSGWSAPRPNSPRKWPPAFSPCPYWASSTSPRCSSSAHRNRLQGGKRGFHREAG
jgi:hypothetical protein